MFGHAARNLARQSTRYTSCQACLQLAISPVFAPQPKISQASLNRYASSQAERIHISSSSTNDTDRSHFNSNTNPKRSKAKPPSHKPPKRRLEAASQPLRNAESINRGPVLQCIAHTTAERYDLPSLGVTLQSLGVRWDEVPEGDRERAFVIGPWKGRGGIERLLSGKDIKRVSPSGQEEESDVDFGYGDRGEIWVFNSGSFVTWGLTEEEGRAFLREIIRRKGPSVEVERLAPKDHEVEEVDFVVDPTAETNILGNLILLGRPPELSSFASSPALASLLARYTLSLSLSRSSLLSVLEDRLDVHIASVSKIPRALARSGAQPMGRREVIRKLGELMTLRMAVNTRGGGLEETPEIYWSEPELESYFDSIATEFEIKERIETFNRKIDYAQEIQSTLRALLTEASGHRMELIIIALIAVEVIIVLIREGPELSHKLLNPVIAYTKSLLGVEDHGRAPSEVIHDEAPKFREGLEHLPHLGILDAAHRSHTEREDRRLV